MQFISVRIITAKLKDMVAFYEKVTGIEATWLNDEFAELRTSTCTVALGSTKTLQFFGGNIAVPAQNCSVILEFRVDDVDASFAMARPFVSECVQEPTTMPWGNRSALFRDPDGNLVNFFTPVSVEAKKKFDVF